MLRINLKGIVYGGIIAAIAFNTAILSRYAFREDNLHRPYPKAKVLMSLADGVNQIYVFPLEIFRPHNASGISPVIFPFISLRDKLYKEGLKNIPINDGERDYWWARIYFAEYRAIYSRLFKHFVLAPTLEEIPIFASMFNSWYGYLTELARDKNYLDSRIQKTRLNEYTGLAMYYTRNLEDYYSWFPKGEPYYKGKYRNRNYSNDLNFNKPFLTDSPEQLKRIASVLQGWLKLKNDVKSNFSEEYKHFQNSPENIKEYLFAYEASSVLLASKILTETLVCTDSLIPIFQRSKEFFPKVNLEPLEENIIDLNQTQANKRESYASVFYSLNSMEQSQLVDKTLKDKCSQ